MRTLTTCNKVLSYVQKMYNMRRHFVIYKLLVEGQGIKILRNLFQYFQLLNVSLNKRHMFSSPIGDIYVQTARASSGFTKQSLKLQALRFKLEYMNILKSSAVFILDFNICALFSANYCAFKNDILIIISIESFPLHSKRAQSILIIDYSFI